MSLSQYGLVGLRKSWVSSHDECLLELLIEQQNCGKTTSNLFKYEVYKTVTQKLNQRFETNVDENQIKLRYYAMKKDYGVIKALLGQPGFHWDAQKQMVAADDKVWENYTAVRRDARPYRWRSFPLYDKMSIIFEDSVVGDVGARNLHLPSRVNRTLEVNSDPETVQVPEPATEPAQLNVDVHDSDSSFHVKNTQPGKRKSKASGRKRSSHVEAEYNIENAYCEMPRANKTRKSVFVATSGFNKSLQFEADYSIENALDKSPSVAMSKGMQKNVNELQCKEKKSKSAATSGYNKRPQFEAQDSIENALEESPFAARSQGVEDLSDARIIYQRCLEELQRIDELDDSEFSQAVCALKDDKNAIAFMTIRGPRRLIWLRSILN
ncbi:uncharacterized protein LOC108224712 [Daucus carota subsp. sativus]|uniref:Myb/SANT-like domain-containing protein n=1 Tax=Daucus carota subsp. sativus TaxID=79200 RepID=A0A161ZUR0_DAUCS|nr:PREDICTED: uncharacterized protein LOC108224712 [Daucus carota subsp. sativus]